MKPPLTDKQQAILHFIKECIHSSACPPTVREIMTAFGYASPHAASVHLKALEKKGYIERSSGRSRGIALVDEPRGIPIVGTVAAGHPVLAEETIDEHLDVDAMFGREGLIAVRVSGDSMVDAAIVDGDFVIVRLSYAIDSGAIGVVYVGGEATVKRILRTETGYRLEPANDAYDPIDIDSTSPEFRIAGPVVGVIRRLRTNGH